MHKILVFIVVLECILQTFAYYDYKHYYSDDICPAFTVGEDDDLCLSRHIDLDLSNFDHLKSKIGEKVEDIQVYHVAPGNPNYDNDCNTAVTVKATFDTLDKVNSYGCFYEPTCDNVQCRHRMLQIDLRLKVVVPQNRKKRSAPPPRKALFNIFNKYQPGANIVHKVVGCEGTQMHLTCTGNKKIKVFSAHLGLDGDSKMKCSSGHHGSDCGSSVIHDISDACDGKPSCFIDVDKCIRTTPCDKYHLSVQYRCTDECDVSSPDCDYVFGYTEGAQIVGFNTDVKIFNSFEQCCKKKGYHLLLPDILNLYSVRKVRIYVSHHFTRILTDDGYDRSQCDDCLFNLDNKENKQDQHLFITLNHLISDRYKEGCQGQGYGILNANFKWVSCMCDRAWSRQHYFD